MCWWFRYGHRCCICIHYTSWIQLYYRIYSRIRRQFLAQFHILHSTPVVLSKELKYDFNACNMHQILMNTNVQEITQDSLPMSVSASLTLDKSSASSMLSTVGEPPWLVYTNTPGSSKIFTRQTNHCLQLVDNKNNYCTMESKSAQNLTQAVHITTSVSKICVQLLISSLPVKQCGTLAQYKAVHAFSSSVANSLQTNTYTNTEMYKEINYITLHDIVSLIWLWHNINNSVTNLFKQMQCYISIAYHLFTRMHK